MLTLWYNLSRNICTKPVEYRHKRFYDVLVLVLYSSMNLVNPAQSSNMFASSQTSSSIYIPGPAIGWVSAGGVERVIVLNQHGCVTLANITSASQSPPQCERRSRCFRTQRERRTPRCAAHDICRRETLRLSKAALVYFGSEQQWTAVRVFVQPYDSCCLD